MNADGLNALSEQILRGAFAVANTLGSGFLEKVYENALAHELRKAGLVVAQQRGLLLPTTVSWWVNTRFICWSRGRFLWNSRLSRRSMMSTWRNA
jgi:hypothetical protein